MKAKKKKLNLLKIILSFLALSSLLFCGCDKPSGFYVDLKQQAIVSCNGMGFKQIRIVSDSDAVWLEGTQSIIFFNQRNDISRVSKSEMIVNDTLKLKPNRNYTITKFGEQDRGPQTLTFTTDSECKVVSALIENCK